MMIKICGIQRIEDVAILNEFEPDYAGFIFAPSKRQITIPQARHLTFQLNKNITTVGVFVNEAIDKIVEVSKFINCIQLHGDEDETYIETLKNHIHNPIIKVVRVQSTAQILDADKSIADFLLLDTYSDASYGGVGQQFDYDLIPDTAHRIFLAGGLNISNIQSAIDVQSYCLDINSGAETDGFKDRDKIKDIIYKIRGQSYER